MSFVHRKLWANKPKQWGPPKAVQAALMDRLEKYDIPWSIVGNAAPLWNPGTPIDYKHIGVEQFNSGVYQNNQIYFAGTYTYATLDQAKENIVDGFTVLFQWDSHDLTGNNGKGVFRHSAVLALGLPTLLLQHTSNGVHWYLNGAYKTIISITGAKQKSGLTFESNSYTAFQNGEAYNYAAGFSGNDGTEFYLGNGYDGYPEVSFDYFLCFTKKIPDERAFELLDNPWQLWQPSTLKTYFDLAAPSETVEIPTAEINITPNDIATTHGVKLQLFDSSTEQASLSGIQAIWWDTETPYASAPVGKSNAVETDADGYIYLDLSGVSSLSAGDSGFLLLYKLDATDHQDSLVFAGKVPTTTIMSGDALS